MSAHQGAANGKVPVTAEEVVWLRQRVAALEHINASLEQQVIIYMDELESVDQLVQCARAEQAEMHNEQQLLRSLLENSSEFIGMVSLEGQLLYLNRAGRELVGVASDDAFRETTMLEYVFPADQTMFLQHILPQLQAEGRWEGELRFRHFQTNAAIPVYYSAFVVKDMQTGQPIAFGTVTRALPM